MKRTVLYFVFLLFVSSCYAQTYNIRDFGANSDSTKLNTKSIQFAIDKCNKDGGGEVQVPAGTYFTGTIFLKSNVYLRLLPGAILQGSYHVSDYPEHDISSKKKHATITHNGMYVAWLKALIIADNLTNAGIIGEGTIKGAGEGRAFQLGENKNGKPMNVLFIGCKNVALKGVRILNSAQITVSISDCEEMSIDGLYINSFVNWNTDGMDIDGRNITVSNCIIDSEDDALCFKSEYTDKPCENITTNNCVLASNCNGLKFGTGSRGGFKNITVSNIVIKKPSRDLLRKWNILPGIVKKINTNSVNTGIVILGVDGGIVENINISNVVMTDVISPIMIRVSKRFLNEDGKPSIMRNISIHDVFAESQSIIPSVIAGLPESVIQDIRIYNVRLMLPGDVNSTKDFPIRVPENDRGYPENRMFGLKLPANSLYARHVNGLYVTNVSITTQAQDIRPVFVFDNVKDAILENIRFNGNTIKNKSIGGTK
ncbi:glycoside hydrolase family 28 protein [Pedobacter psychrodurus]|uniref:Glycoside hydrolase family 28 protein n=1 Tax=Pedobacter psychrodurus TaxID=2530456 RepID=A0A4R0PZ96_9SPHI|nr:glycosyl hydrolase family 28 protein [Pedobacter psychrodurus]TCD28570.1 glycoside hydrolase family 28 protein [Pedobacter psychrodurus]